MSDGYTTMNSCPSAGQLQAYFNYQLDQRQSDTIKSHISGPPPCPNCERILEGLKESSDASLLELADTPPPDSPSTAALQPGTVLGNCELLEKVGEGGMGEVWKSRQQKAGRVVALKVIRTDRLGRADGFRWVERFRREALAAGPLEHDHIVRVYDVGEALGHLYYVMQYVPGYDLGQFLKSNARPAPQGLHLSPEQAVEYLEQVARAVHYVHQKGRLHRDLKPANILINRENSQAYVSDFGLARILSVAEESPVPAEPGEPPHLTHGGMGTPGYVAPEQARNAAQATVRSDVYSLGAVLCVLLTGQTPRQPAQSMHNLGQVLGPAPEHTSGPGAARASAVPLNLQAIALKCLQVDPANRYKDAETLADDLRRHQLREPIEARPVGWGQRLGLWCRRNPLVAGLLVLAATLLAGGMGGILYFGFEANRNAAAEQQQRHLAEGRETIAQRHAYAATLGNAPGLLEANRLSLLADLLRATRPEQIGGQDHRGWEWYYLFGQLRSEQLRFREHRELVRAAIFSPDGRYVASADEGGVILVWDAGTGAVAQRLDAGSAVLGLAFSPDGETLAAACQDATAVVLRWKNGRLVSRLSGHVLAINDVAFSRDGLQAATASLDNTVKVWEVATGRETATLVGHQAQVSRVWFRQAPGDGPQLASVGHDGSLRFWALPEGKEVETARGQGALPNLALSPTFQRLASLLVEKMAIAVIDLATQKPVMPFIRVDDKNLSALHFDTDGNRLTVADEEGSAFVWDVAAVRLVSQNRAQASTSVLSPRGDRIVCVCKDGDVRIWPAKAPYRDDFVGHAANVQRVQFHPQGGFLAAGDTTGSIRLWSMQTRKTTGVLGMHIAEKGPEGSPPSADLQKAQKAGLFPRNIAGFAPPAGGYRPDSLRQVYVFEGHAGRVQALDFSGDGRRLVSAAMDNNVHLWDLESAADGRTLTGKVRHVLAHPLLAPAAAISPDGTRVATGCWDEVVRIWNAENGTVTNTLAGHAGAVNAVLFHPNGRWVISAGQDRIIRLWDIETGSVLREFKEHTDQVHSLALSADARLLASGAGDRTVRVWELDTGKVLQVLRGHGERVTGLAFHPTQERLASASNHPQDGTVRIWDLGISREILALKAPLEQAAGLAFDPTGRVLAVTAGHQVALWEAADRARAEADPLTSAPPRQSLGEILETSTPAPNRDRLELLGFHHASSLRRLHDKSNPLKPSGPNGEFFVVIASIPQGWLFPNPEQYEHLRQDPDNPVVPPRFCALYDPARFSLVSPDGKTHRATAVGPLPAAHESGFESGILVERSTAGFHPHARSLVAIAWDGSPPALGEPPLKVRVDAREPVAIPNVNLKDYRGQTGSALQARPWDLLSRQRTYSKY